jgi:hypothetical protein
MGQLLCHLWQGQAELAHSFEQMIGRHRLGNIVTRPYKSSSTLMGRVLISPVHSDLAARQGGGL